MSFSSWLTVAVSVLCLSACAAVLDEVAPGGAAASAVVIRPAPVSVRAPVELSEKEFRAAMRWLAPQVRLPAPFGQLALEGQVLPAAWAPPRTVGEAGGIPAERYEDWCGRRHKVWGDCLHILHGRSTLDAEARYTVAFDIALGAEWDGFMQELRGMVDITTLRVVLVSAVMAYVLLLVVPEPISKVAAVVLTMAAAAYLGVQTLWNVVQGWLQMVAEADAARTFVELQAAGERYGERMGAQTARVLVMLVTAAISEGGLPQQMGRLPGYARASSALAEDTGGFGLKSVEQVRSVTVSASQVSAELAQATQSTSLAMAAAQSGSNVKVGKSKPEAPERKEPGEWRKAKSPARGRAGKYQEQITKHSPAEGYMVNGVEFDGYEPGEDTLLTVESGDGVLLDAKGKGYAKFFQDNLTPQKWFESSGAKKLQEQAARQINAAPGVKIRWHVAEKKAADAIKDLLSQEATNRIDVVYTPMQ